MEKYMGKKLRIQQQNSGFSLVELIIAIAILVIVTGAVCSFIIITSRNYANGNNDISVQQEAQLALNQMSDVIIDATQSINYVGYDESNQPVKALKDSEFTFTPEKKALIVYNTVTPASGEGTEEPSAYADPGTPAEDSSTELHNYMFYWQKSDENLYFSMADAGGSFPMPGEVDCVLLAENVTEFQVDLSQVEERRVVKLKLNFQTGTRKFEMANNITVRNKVVINNADIEPLDKRVRVNIKVKEPVVVLEPGETFHFSTPKVTGTNLLNKNVTWKIEGEVSEGTKMLSPNRDGILQIDSEERLKSFDVKVTTEAIDEESKKQAETTITVYVKRVTKVTLNKKSEELLNPNDNIPGKLEVMQGSTVVLVGTVDGVNLGNKCDSCGEDPTGDRYLTGWTVVSGSTSLQNGIQDSDHETATIQIKADAAVGSTITIRAVSDLSSRRPYGPVQGEITLKVVEKKNPAKPTGGQLQYGDKIKMDELLAGFTTTIDHHVICIRIVDNSGEESDQIVAYHNTGWNIWVEPECFNLDLTKTYTFYMQALEAVSKEHYKEWQEKGGYIGPEPDGVIWNEYINHVSSKAPYGYEGDVFQYSEVYYATLEPPKVAFTYNKKRYVDENIVCDDYNLLSDSWNAVLGDLNFDETQDSSLNISISKRVMNNMTYSLYVGEENDQSQWTKIRTFDADSKQYISTELDNKYVSLSQNSHSPVLNIKDKQQLATSGTYHIVPGFQYTRSPETTLNLVGSQNYDTSNRGTIYYESSNSTIHVTISAETTMDVDSSTFKGGVCFPLPGEMKTDWRFPNLDKTDWQQTNISWGMYFRAIAEGANNLTSITISGVNYRYVPESNAYEVEPYIEQTRDNTLKITISLGVYRCGVNGKKWERQSEAKESNNGTLLFSRNGKEYLTYYPLPTQDNFPFEKEKEEQQYKEGQYINGYEKTNLLNGSTEGINCARIYCEYDKNTKTYTLTLAEGEETKDNFWTIRRIYGKYQWESGMAKWSRIKDAQAYVDTTANLNMNLDGQVYRTFIPEVSDSNYWNGNSNEVWRDLAFYQDGDVTGNTRKQLSCKLKRQQSNGIDMIEIWDNGGNSCYGKYQYDSTLKCWKLSGN
jgi:prepilin-type cleavage/methylation N-terminal domain protein